MNFTTIVATLAESDLGLFVLGIAATLGVIFFRPILTFLQTRKNGVRTNGRLAPATAHDVHELTERIDRFMKEYAEGRLDDVRENSKHQVSTAKFESKIVAAVDARIERDDRLIARLERIEAVLPRR